MKAGRHLDHELELMADFYTPVDDKLFHREIRVSKDTARLDYPTSIGSRMALAGDLVDTTTFCVAKLVKVSKWLPEYMNPRAEGLEILTTEPGIHLFRKFLDGTLTGKSGGNYETSWILSETQHFPDSPNKPHFPASAALR